jgi:hypothetical protein
MKALIGFERSGKTREAINALPGWSAYSCDLETADDNSEKHYQTDIRKALNSDKWDLIILHPPCTALAVSGNRWYGEGMPKHEERLYAIGWTMALWFHARHICDHVAMENPVGVLPMKATQYVQPWQFGHGETKKTGFWLHNLPPLQPTNIVEGREQRIWRMAPGEDRAKMRSETYQGIADAMARQWTDFVAQSIGRKTG